MHIGGGEGGLNLTELPVSTKWDSGASLTQTPKSLRLSRTSTIVTTARSNMMGPLIAVFVDRLRLYVIPAAHAEISKYLQ